MKNLLPTLLASLFCAGLFAQNLSTKASMVGGGSDYDGIMDVISDASGNSYVTGYFSGTVDFDPGMGVYNLNTPLGSNWDAFIQKLDANGNFLWAKSFRGTYDDYEMGESLSVDDSGNVYLQGYFKRNIFFTLNGIQWPGNPNVGSTTFNYSPFLVKLDSVGNVKWGLGWQNATQTGFCDANGITLDALGNVYMVGEYSTSVDFDPTSASVQMLTNTSGLTTDAFVVKLSNSGQVLAASNLGIPSILYGVDADASAVYVSGSGYVKKINTALGTIWSKQLTGIKNTELTVSPNGYVYVCGTFLGIKDFDPSPTSTFMLNAGAQESFFISKLDTSGNFIWAKALLTSSAAPMWSASSLSHSNLDDVALSGDFAGTLDADPGTSANMLTSMGGLDAFVVVLDSSGTFKAAGSVGSTGWGGEKFIGVHFKTNNELLVGGRFEGTMDVDLSGSINSKSCNGPRDFMMLNLGLCGTTAPVPLNITSCGSYTAPSGATYTTSGTYYDTLPNIVACDSILAISLTVLPSLNPTVTQTINGLEANATGSNLVYQWLNCANNQLVPNAAAQTFMPTTNGQYAVIVDNGDCIDTSACFAINNVSISENNLLGNVTFFPNPTTGLLNIQSAQPWQSAEVSDLLGRMVLTQAYNLAGQTTPTTELDLSKLPTGVYLVKVFFTEGVVVQRVVKE